MRIKVEGSLKHTTWTDDNSGEERSKWVLYADDIALVLGRVEAIEIRKKTEKPS